MKFTIEKTEFLRGLRIARDVANPKSTMPILANVLLRANGDKLLLDATDLGVSLSATLTSAAEEDGAITVNAKALRDIVASMPGDDVVMSTTASDWVKITSGDATFKLAAIPPEDFPKIHGADGAKFSQVSATILLEMIEKTLFATSENEAQFHLSGCLLESDGSEARLVATDGHRLTFIKRAEFGLATLESGVIVPRKALAQLKHLLGNTETCEIAVEHPWVFIVSGGLQLAAKLADAQFPPYEMVIPKGHTKHATVGRIALLDALKRARLVSSEEVGITLTVEPEAVLFSCENPQRGTMNEKIAAVYDGEPVTVKLSARYAAEFLAACSSDEITLSLEGELDPVLMHPLDDESYLGVVMPMRA